MNAHDLVLRRPWALHDPINSLGRFRDVDVTAAVEVVAETRREPPELNIIDGVAVIPVTGVLFYKDDFLTDFFGIPTYESIARHFKEALRSSAVRSILFDLHSPGGEALGIHELSNLVYQSRGVKPTGTYVGGWAASAAYWLASATDRIWTDATGMLGSIGTIAHYIDDKGWLQKMGLREIVIVSEQSPNKHTDPATPDGEARIRQLITDLAAVFIADVARNRGVSEEAVINDFGQGWVKLGEDAVAAKLADDLGSLESAIEGMASSSTRSRTVSGVRLNNAKGAKMTIEELKANHPELVAQLQAEARSDLDAQIAAARTEAASTATAAERKRIADLEAHALPGHEELLAEAKSSGMPLEEFLAKQTRAEQQAATGALRTIQADEQEMQKPRAAASDDVGDEGQVITAAGPASRANVNRILTAGRRVRESK